MTEITPFKQSGISNRSCRLFQDELCKEEYQLERSPTKWTPEEGLSSIFVINETGANLEQQVYHYQKERGDLLLTFGRTVTKQDNVEHEKWPWDLKPHMDACFPGDRIFIFLEAKQSNNRSSDGDGDQNRRAIIVVGICCCEECHAAPVNAPALTPVEVTVGFTSGGSPPPQRSCTVLKLYPGCTDKFDLRSDVSPSNMKRLIYYGLLNLNQLDGLPWQHFELGGRVKGALRNNVIGQELVARLEITRIRACSEQSKFPELSVERSILKGMLESGRFTDFTIVSCDGEEHPCHKGVLAERSPIFNKLLSQTDFAGNQEGIRILEDPDITGNVTRTFLKYVYYRDTSIIDNYPIGARISLATSWIKLGYTYQIPDMLAKGVDIITETCRRHDVSRHPDTLWVAYNYILGLDKIQIVARLKTVLESILK